MSITPVNLLSGACVLFQCFDRGSLQALYFCVPFREQLLEYYAANKNVGDSEENLLTCLADLFTQVQYIID